jgi:curved DNA-binding protein CbpA
MALGSDPYGVLGVPRDATGTQIAQARHLLVLKYHPDMNDAPDAAAAFDEVQQAFRLLSDPEKRAEYDRAHEEPPSGPPGGAGVPRFYVDPASVDFRLIEPGKPGAYRDVAVYWTGEPPARITSEPGNGWWTVLNTGRLGSKGVVFHLYAAAPAEAAHGRHQAKLSISLDDAPLTVPLRAEIGVKPPSYSDPFEFSPLTPAAALPEWVLPAALGFVVLVVIVSIVAQLVGYR